MQNIEPSHHVSTEKMSLVELMSRLPVGQLWGFLGIVLGIVVAAFYGAWSIKGTVEDVKLQAAIAKADDSERKLSSAAKELAVANERIAQMKDKDRFLTLHLRYELAKHGADIDARRDAEKAFSHYIEAKIGKSLNLSKGAKVDNTTIE